MDPGEVCIINLEGIAWSIPMGTVAVNSAEEESRFEVGFNIPENTPPGTYAVPIATDQGENTEAGLMVTSLSAQPSTVPAAILKPQANYLKLVSASLLAGQVIKTCATALVNGLAGL